jgi:hypothetical protein
MMIVALRRKDLLVYTTSFLFPTRQLSHFYNSGLWLKDYHLQCELEMLMVTMIVALSRKICWYTQPVFISHKAILPLS